MQCPICKNERFEQTEILKQRLIQEWELGDEEVDYINRQQGYHCSVCLCSLRVMTLADCIMKNYSFKGSFNQFCFSTSGIKLKLLEINTAGGLHSYLRNFRQYTYAEYPDVDIQKLPYKNNSFDLIVHSDTLEHVEDSLTALKECFRTLKESGSLFYTVPIVYGRMTRKRDLLSNSYHGSQEETQGEDYKVWTEYGADFWVELFNAGFKKISLHSLGDMSSIAICAKKEISGKYRHSILISCISFVTRALRRLIRTLNKI